MNTYIALLRGINVGGHNTLPMQALAAILHQLKFQDIKTYIQSGNVVFRGAADKPAQYAQQISSTIFAQHGFAPQVLVLTLQTFKTALANNPYPAAVAEPTSLHLGFLAEQPAHPDLQKLASLKQPGEQFHLGDGVFYLYARAGIGKSKLAGKAEKLLGVAMTDRNWRTACKLLELAEKC